MERRSTVIPHLHARNPHGPARPDVLYIPAEVSVMWVTYVMANEYHVTGRADGPAIPLGHYRLRRNLFRGGKHGSRINRISHFRSDHIGRGESPSSAGSPFLHNLRRRKSTPKRKHVFSLSVCQENTSITEVVSHGLRSGEWLCRLATRIRLLFPFAPCNLSLSKNMRLQRVNMAATDTCEETKVVHGY